MIKFLTGNGVKPWLVGVARGAAEAALLGALYVAWEAFANAPGEVPVWALPAALAAFKAGEGVIDNIDPSKHRANGLE